MSDTSDVDAAVINRLLGDATLTTLMPGGVYWGVASHGKTQFVIVSQVIHTDVPMLQGTAFESVLYLVKAVELTTSGANIVAAARRINELLDHVTFAVTGYGFMNSARIERVRDTEVDEMNPDQRWQHRGGRYEVTVSR